MSLRATQRFPIDWTSLFTEDKLASRGLQKLLKSEPIQFRFEVASAAATALWSLYWSYRMGIRQRGLSTLYFYYPAFTGKETETQQLLRWPCQLTPPTGTEEKWSLIINSEATGEVNNHWLHWAQSVFPHDWENLLHEIARPGDRAAALRELTQAMNRETPWAMSSADPGLIKMASLASFSAELERGGLAWLATLAVDNGSWKKRPEINGRSWSSANPQIYDYPYLMPLSPGEAQAWVELGQEGRVAIGAMGSMESTTHLLSKMVLPHLVAGEPILVIARDQCTLDQLQNSLTKQGWESLLSRWQNERLDWAILQANVQAYLKSEAKNSSTTDESWQVAFGRYRREEKQLQQFLSSSRRPVFGNEPWQQVLGLYLRASRREGKALLATHLQASYYTFTPAEYADIQQAIKQTQPLYAALDTPHHPLADLNAAIFIHQDEEEASDFVERTTQRLLNLTRPLHQRYIRRQSEYADQLMTQQEKIYLELRQRWSTLNALLSDLSQHYGNEILTVRQGTLRLKAAFSKRWQAATRERQALISAYSALRSYHGERSPFEVEWLAENWPERPVELPAFLESYERKLMDWQLGLPSLVQEELLRLNYKTADSSLAASAHIQPLEMALEECIDEVNAVGLYQLPLQSKHLTLLKQQRNLEEIIERLERTRAGIEPFSAFYAWQRNWFSLSEIARKSIQAILRSRPTDWSAAFASWYFNECLAQTHAPALHFRLSAGEDGVYGRQQLRQQTQQQVVANWRIRKLAAAKTLQVATRQQADISLGKLDAGLGKALSRFGPIALATPELGAKLQAHYPQLIVLEGQRLDETMLKSLVHTENQRVSVLFDEDITVSSTPWTEAKWPLVNVHAAEQKPGEVPHLPSAVFKMIPGLYQSESATNEEEALAVLDWLNTLPADRGKRVARVGIVCFTEGQRNRILQLLYEVKKTHQAAAEHLQRLERNGLQVLYLEDLADYSFTHLLVSVVFGPKNARGEISAEVARLSEPSLHAALLTLIKCWSRAEEVRWLCALPESYWAENTAEHQGSLLSQMLRTAAGKAGAWTLSDYIPSIQEASTIKSNEFDPLSRELIFRIGDHFPHWQWAYHRSLGPAHAILEARTMGGKRILFLPDGLLSQTEVTTFEWEWTQQERLRSEGFELISIPLASIWKSPTTAFHQLLRQLRGLTTILEEE